MKYDEFVLKVKDAKRSEHDTAYFNQNCVFSSNSEHTRQLITKTVMCYHGVIRKTILIELVFIRGVYLTVFQAGLLYALFVLNRLPLDYAQYHKCVSGQKFINSLVSVKVLL